MNDLLLLFPALLIRLFESDVLSKSAALCVFAMMLPGVDAEQLGYSLSNRLSAQAKPYGTDKAHC